MKAGAKLGTTQSTLYTVPTGTVEALTFNIANTDANNTVEVTLLASSDGGTTWHEFFKADVQPKSTVQITGNVFDGDDQIAGVAGTANVVSVVITGVGR